MQTNLKILERPTKVKERTLERAALAAKIAAREATADLLVEIDNKKTDFENQRYSLRREIEAAEEEIGRLEASAGARLVAAGTVAEALAPIKKLRERIVDAEAEIAVLQSADKSLTAEYEKHKNKLRDLEYDIKGCASAVVKSDPATRALIETFAARVRELAPLAAAVWTLREAMIPEDLKALLTLEALYCAGPKSPPWLEAFEALGNDADAVLPVIA